MLESLFIKAFRWFPVNISFVNCILYLWIVKSSFFYRTPLVAASANVLFCIIFSKRRCWIYCSFTLHNCFILKSKITLIAFVLLYHSLSFVVSRCQSLSFIVTRCHSLSLVVTRCNSFSLAVTNCTTRCHWLSLVVICCLSLHHSLSLDVPLFCLFINDQFQESYNVSYFKEIKPLKIPQEAETYLETKRASTIKPFCEYT